MAPIGQSGTDVFAQLNDLFHEPEDGEQEPYCYHDADFLRGLLEKERELLSKVVQENIDLIDAGEKQTAESFTIQEVQSREIEEKKSRIEELEALVDKRDQELEQLRIDSAALLFEECQKLKIKNQQLHDTMSKQVEELEGILAGLQDFRDRQVEVEERMSLAENYAAKTRAEMEMIIPDLERNFIEKCSVHEKEFEKKFAELKLVLTAEVEDRVTERTKSILAYNEQLLEDLKIHMGATSGLTKERDYLQAETSNLSSEIGILKKAGDLHIQRGIAQGRVVEQHQAKLLILERSLRQVIRQYGAERSELQNTHRQVVADLTSEKQALKNLVISKTKELKKLRCLAQHVVNQRSEVENFLIESLEHIKLQLAAAHQFGSRDRDNDNKRRRDDEEQSSNASSTHLPSIRSSHSWPGARTDRSYIRSSRFHKGFETNTKCKHPHHDFVLHLDALDAPSSQTDLPDDYNDFVPKLLPKVDISDLSWTDREKVLRYLFQKIIHAHTSTSKQDRESNGHGLRRGFAAPFTVSEAGRLLA